MFDNTMLSFITNFLKETGPTNKNLPYDGKSKEIYEQEIKTKQNILKDQHKIQNLKGKIHKLDKDVVAQKKTEKKAIKKLIKIEKKAALKKVKKRIKNLKNTLKQVPIQNLNSIDNGVEATLPDMELAPREKPGKNFDFKTMTSVGGVNLGKQNFSFKDLFKGKTLGEKFGILGKLNKTTKGELKKAKVEGAVYFRKMYNMIFVKNQLQDFTDFLKEKYNSTKITQKLFEKKLDRLVEIKKALRVEQKKAKEVERQRLNMVPIIEPRNIQEAKPSRVADIGAPIFVVPADMGAEYRIDMAGADKGSNTHNIIIVKKNNVKPAEPEPKNPSINKVSSSQKVP